MHKAKVHKNGFSFRCRTLGCLSPAKFALGSGNNPGTHHFICPDCLVSIIVDAPEEEFQKSLAERMTEAGLEDWIQEVLNILNKVEAVAPVTDAPEEEFQKALAETELPIVTNETPENPENIDENDSDEEETEDDSEECDEEDGSEGDSGDGSEETHETEQSVPDENSTPVKKPAAKKKKKVKRKVKKV